MPDEDLNEDELPSFDELERDVLYLLTDPDDNQPVWSIEDLSREIDRPAYDAIAGLHRAGLVNRTADGFVFATRAAVRMVRMVGQAV